MYLIVSNFSFNTIVYIWGFAILYIAVHFSTCDMCTKLVCNVCHDHTPQLFVSTTRHNKMTVIFLQFTELISNGFTIINGDGRQYKWSCVIIFFVFGISDTEPMQYKHVGISIMWYSTFCGYVTRLMTLTVDHKQFTRLSIATASQKYMRSVMEW